MAGFKMEMDPDPSQFLDMSEEKPQRNWLFFISSFPSISRFPLRFISKFVLAAIIKVNRWTVGLGWARTENMDAMRWR